MKDFQQSIDSLLVVHESTVAHIKNRFIDSRELPIRAKLKFEKFI